MSEQKKETRSQEETKVATEAAIQKKAEDAKAKVPKKEGEVLFVSTGEENAAFMIRAGGVEVRAIRNKDTKSLIFRVPASVVSDFEKHEFVVNGRIKKVEDKK